MPSIQSVREVAKIVCINSGAPCVQVGEPQRQPCTYENCRMMEIAREALQKAEKG
jgi:hypothetical protein